jgi:uncharacterized protein YacL
MTPNVTLNLLRVLFIIFALTIGGAVGLRFDAIQNGTIVGLLIGLAVVLADRLLKGFSLRIFSSATFGLFLGFLFTRLLLASEVIKYVAEDWQWVISITLYGVFGYIGMILASRSNRDEFALIIPFVRFQNTGANETPILVDTNILIDSRIIDICETGFLRGSLVVPRFVLEELQFLGESGDVQKREKGRMGLDCLEKIQGSRQMIVTIHETLPDPGTPVDTRLVQLARTLHARLLTNDANLCRIARLQDIAVLNLNDLAKALRTIIAVGSEIEIPLVKEGRDAHQAVGYLPDGTMVVVNHARPKIGATVAAVIISQVQTSGGRMLFAELKNAVSGVTEPARS